MATTGGPKNGKNINHAPRQPAPLPIGLIPAVLMISQAAPLRALTAEWGKFTNCALHPMMGAIAGFIQVQNDPDGMVADIDASSDYWGSRMQALAWSTAFSFMFELGPMSEANIGNVGLHPRDSSEHPMAWVDLVVTPVVGTMWLVGEDALDRYVVSRIEDTGWNNHVKAAFRVALNPSRSIANIARLKTPWHRD